MHIKRLTKLAEWLEAGGHEHKLTFDMTRGLHFKDITNHTKMSACETTCCIAGAATYFFNSPSKLFKELKKDNRKEIADLVKNHGFTKKDAIAYAEVEVSWEDIKEEAQALLQLKDAQATALFTPDRVLRGDLYHFNDPAWAARVIRNLIKTGVVDWLGQE